MSGHSKWSSIKHQKGVADARRGQLFTKLSREIIVAVRQGGANSDMNFRLRLAVQKARDNSMPSENIDRAIKKGSGTSDSGSLAEINLEGYGPSGVAIMIETLSDNRNRTIQDVRGTLSRGGGNLGENGCVSWLFTSKGVITVNTAGQDVEELELEAIEAGADDMEASGDYIEIYTKPEEMEKIRETFMKKEIPVESAEIQMIPSTTVDLDEKNAFKTLKLLEKLEALDDVQHVYSNADFSDDILQKYQEGN